MLIGSVGALYQVRFKRMLGYSAIANLGYVLLGFCSGSAFGCFSAFYYFFVYIILSLNIFSILVIIRRYPSNAKLCNLSEVVSITHSNFLLSLLLVFCLLSLAGIPPLIGFFGKFFVFMSLIFSGHYFLALYGALFSVLTCVYYIRLIRFILFEKPEKLPVYYLLPISNIQAYFVVFISILNIFFFFFQGPLLYFLYDSFIYVYFDGILDIYVWGA